MVTAIQVVYAILGIVAALSTAMVFIVNALLKAQRQQLTQDFKTQMGDATLSGKMSEIRSQVLSLSRQVEVLENRLDRVESNATDDRKIIKKHFPETYQRKSDS